MFQESPSAKISYSRRFFLPSSRFQLKSVSFHAEGMSRGLPSKVIDIFNVSRTQMRFRSVNTNYFLIA